MSRWQWLLTRMTRQLWFRATLIGALGIAAAGLAALTEHLLPWDLPTTIGADAVDGILNIIASSMLAVTTFSLSVMTSAYSAATSNVTPRAIKLLIEDRLTQNVLSSFIGSFLFSIVGIVVLKTGAYGDSGRFVLFIVTIAVIALVVVSLLRWIDHLTRLGRVGETTERVEEATQRAIDWRCANPYLGGSPAPVNQAIPDNVLRLTADTVGYVQHVDMTALAEQADCLDSDIHLLAAPGAFVYPDTPLAWIDLQHEDDKALKCVREAFSIGKERSFDQDPRFGLAVLSEIASRALSPAVNDPGTAIDVLGRQARVLCTWARDQQADQTPQFPRVWVEALHTRDLFEDAFNPIARDGASLLEVQMKLRKTLQALSQMGDAAFRQAAFEQAERALARAEQAMTQEADKQRLRELR
ncbi:conserved membrane hypothetical protein [Pseudomonas sp. 8Z]|uniref:DUF2254 domain-containing protein n=1 Tax=Pseudomonas sp. 8Z TaxID=2653166 RepID=UPI0012EFF960|nr:DUF2254 domain-containing protein [Pseudomonas sp. 8Z]VXD02938.1 conserved membrane hypothetical protein [Pseudomonas sp. 8Z]